MLLTSRKVRKPLYSEKGAANPLTCSLFSLPDTKEKNMGCVLSSPLFTRIHMCTVKMAMLWYEATHLHLQSSHSFLSRDAPLCV